MLNKIIAIIVAVIVAGLLSVIGVQSMSLTKARNQAATARTEADQYQRSLTSLQGVRAAEIQQAEKGRAALQARTLVAEKAAKVAQKESESLREALKANRDWADSPLPDRVRDSIAR